MVTLLSTPMVVPIPCCSDHRTVVLEYTVGALMGHHYTECFLVIRLNCLYSGLLKKSSLFIFSQFNQVVLHTLHILGTNGRGSPQLLLSFLE